MSPRRMPKEALTSNESYARVADLHRALSQWCGLGFCDLKDISSVARRSSSTSTSQQNRGACEAAKILAKILAAKALGARMCACCVFCFCILIIWMWCFLLSFYVSSKAASMIVDLIPAGHVIVWAPRCCRRDRYKGATDLRNTIQQRASTNRSHRAHRKH